MSSAIDAGFSGPNENLKKPRREEHFRELWAFVDRHGFHRAGYTLLTPLPGTTLFEQESARGRLKGRPWAHYDMHHCLWEPRLGSRRFFELYAETWRRSILNLGGRKRWSDWARQVRPSQVPYLTRVLWRTQRMMSPDAYLAEHRRTIGVPPARSITPPGRAS